MPKLQDNGEREGEDKDNFSDEIRATLVHHVLIHGRTMREAGQLVQPNLSRYMVASIVHNFRRENRVSEPDARADPHEYIFTDEAGFNLSKRRKKGNNIIGHRAIIQVSGQRRGSVTLCAAISNRGVLLRHVKHGCGQYDRNPYAQRNLLEAMVDASGDVSVESIQSFLRHTRAFFPRYLAGADNVKMTSWILLVCGGLAGVVFTQRSEPMFSSVTHSVLPPDYDNNPTQLNYGVAVTDVDGDGDLEIFVAGYNGPNLVLKYDKSKKRLVNIAVENRSSPFYALRDRQGNAIGVTACDIDGDGREEIYVLNTNNAFSGRATYTHKLFKFRNGRFEDLLNDEINSDRDVANSMAGRSVACVDRKGTGRYGIYVAHYASGSVGPHALIEMDESASDVSRGLIALSNVAEEAGVRELTGGRGVAVGPILSRTLSDIFCDNEYGPNFLYRNNGDGTFTDVAAQSEVDDKFQHGRGVALADFNRDGKTDIVYGNWNGPHRLFLQLSNNRKQRFKDIASQKFSMPSPVRTVIAADFDNDNELEVFFNNIAYRGPSANRLFRVSRREHGDPQIEELNVGDAAEPDGRGTGAAVTDFDGDGHLDLLITHGESAAQPISVYRVNQGSSNRWLRVIPRTQFGAFARGAKVVVYTKKTGPHSRIIDGGSGYLCEMEPVAHFGLGKDVATSVEVYWPDGRSVARPLEASDMNTVMEILYPYDGEETTPAAEIECGHGFVVNQQGRCADQDECTQFPSVCPPERPICTNTFGSYKCRANKKCTQGYQPNVEGTACVAQVAYFGGNRSSGLRPWASYLWPHSLTLLALLTSCLEA
ncbi:cartilage acidic protein 1 [Chanos chanos]|uniref:Cartilage acidic protein 1 n=1 Tax=Chanos chanos TaxID=29144 RepID=A0A6J2V7H5_CHACN|nr:cartilage acidic protein 1 [Chanos chanos]